MHGSHPSLRFPEVRVVVEALAHESDLPPPPLARDWDGLRADLFNWLGATLGFQLHNVRNQREHLVLLLANPQLRAGGTPSIPSDHPANVLHHSVARGIRKKLLKNYMSWCSYLGKRPHVYVPSGGRRVQGVGLDTRRDLLYTALYLLIWGQAANLRFMPECLCYIFHYMALDLNQSSTRPLISRLGGHLFLRCTVRMLSLSRL
jgi:callose synthase